MLTVCSEALVENMKKIIFKINKIKNKSSQQEVEAWNETKEWKSVSCHVVCIIQWLERDKFDLQCCKTVSQSRDPEKKESNSLLIR